MQRLESKIRSIANFPRPGILFRDITPLLGDPAALKLAVQHLVRPFLGEEIDAVAGMEARGFIFGSLVATELDVGFVPLRKPGKLPGDVRSVSYDLEYGSAALEAHIDALEAGARVLLTTTCSPRGEPQRRAASSSKASAAKSPAAPSSWSSMRWAAAPGSPAGACTPCSASETGLLQGRKNRIPAESGPETARPGGTGDHGRYTTSRARKSAISASE